jgi:hypothetical protein
MDKTTENSPYLELNSLFDKLDKENEQEHERVTNTLRLLETSNTFVERQTMIELNVNAAERMRIEKEKRTVLEYRRAKIGFKSSIMTELHLKNLCIDYGMVLVPLPEFQGKISPSTVAKITALKEDKHLHFDHTSPHSDAYKLVVAVPLMHSWLNAISSGLELSGVLFYTNATKEGVVNFVYVDSFGPKLSILSRLIGAIPSSIVMCGVFVYSFFAVLSMLTLGFFEILVQDKINICNPVSVAIIGLIYYLLGGLKLTRKLTTKNKFEKETLMLCQKFSR